MIFAILSVALSLCTATESVDELRNQLIAAEQQREAMNQSDFQHAIFGCALLKGLRETDEFDLKQIFEIADDKFNEKVKPKYDEYDSIIETTWDLQKQLLQKLKDQQPTEEILEVKMMSIIVAVFFKNQRFRSL